MRPGQVVYRITGEEKPAMKAAQRLASYEQSAGKIVRLYGDPASEKPDPLPSDADVIIIVEEFKKP